MRVIRLPLFSSGQPFYPRLELPTVCALVIVFTVTTTSADTFGSGANAFSVDFVNIGNPGNSDDAGAGGGVDSSPFGGVSYVYRIGVTEVPQDWITRATNLGMTNVTAGGWTGMQPATNLSWYEAAAFVNWLNTSTGHRPAYNLTFNGSWGMSLWSSAQAWQLGGENLFRHKDAYYFLPSEDEWYKAAYHQNDGVTANYWDYATGSNTLPLATNGGTQAGTAVYNRSAGPTAVDNNGGLSPYGTRGQNGNAYEWTESALDGINDSESEFRVSRGGNWGLPEQMRPSWRTLSIPPGLDSLDLTLRIASVPEPSVAVLTIAGLGALLLRRRRVYARGQIGQTATMRIYILA